MSRAPPRRCSSRWTPARSTIACSAMSPPSPAIVRALERMGKRPLLDLGMRLGEGTGAALAAGIVKAAARDPRRHGDVRRGRRLGRRTPELSRSVRQRLSRALVSLIGGSASMTRDSGKARDHLGALAKLRFQLERAVMHASSAPATIGRPRPAPCSALLMRERALAEGREHDRDFLGRDARSVVA